MEVESGRVEYSSPTGEKPPARNRLLRPVSWRGRRGWLTVAVAFALLAVLISWISAARKKIEPEETEATVVSVQVAKAERGTISSEVSALGTIFPREVATVSSIINAQIKHMPLVRNKQVRAGDVIAALESRDIQAQRAEAASALEEAQANARLMSGGTIPEATAQDQKAVRDAQANVTNARATFERRRQLYERGGISKKDLEASQLALTTAENELRAAETAAKLHQSATNPSNRELAASRVKQAQGRLAALDTQLSYATVRAPFSGVITEQFQYEGEYAAAGAKLFTIADVGEVIVKAPFPDTVAARIKVGDPATVLPQELSGEELTGAVSLVSRASDPQSRTVEIWVNLKNEGGRLRAASAAKVVIATSTESDAVVVPSSAVTLAATNADEGTVMVVDGESVAHETKVTVGIRTDDRVQITSGLQGGETVVVEGNYALPDESKVEMSEGGEEKNGGAADKEGGKGGEKSKGDGR
ncbi:MAG TPA: efflux RND transporter periplasmic adaptor subunit [Blastocatellia bacterium]|jgi:multidrug efflux pump subunit AcrA (membrane-fusion protein)|nr:efflux RND transporter periplasmic adaptor subunit [Blastocatellia bacterium]